MQGPQHKDVCDRTERKEERVRVRNIKTGQEGMTFSCTPMGETIQVEFDDGSLDSWPAADCEEVP